MILFIIMKEIRVSMGHTLGLKLIIVICFVSKGMYKRFHYVIFNRLKVKTSVNLLAANS
jgi:hypothetical protein